MEKEIPEKLQKYPQTEWFQVVDTIGVPHPYCVTPKHIEAAQRYSGRLGKEAIEDLESRRGPSCGIRGCNLKFKEHEQALLVKCRIKDNELLQKYLQSIADMCEEDGYAGFTPMLAEGVS